MPRISFSGKPLSTVSSQIYIVRAPEQGRTVGSPTLQPGVLRGRDVESATIPQLPLRHSCAEFRYIFGAAPRL